jgi:CTP:phosphocholine cytidylyltransferase-like protein
MRKGTDALILAAGMGKRMLPLTERYAKPLVPVCGTTMIETVIDAHSEQDVSRIIIVVGYKKEQFEFLTGKYQNVVLIENKEYERKNNVSSIAAAADLLGERDCFICEADLFISDPGIFSDVGERSCYFGKPAEADEQDWIFDVRDGRSIEIRIGRAMRRTGGDSVYKMTGGAFWRNTDLRILIDTIRETCERPGHENLFWDEVVNAKLDVLRLSIRPVSSEQMVEIDTVAELEKFIKLNGPAGRG